MGRPSARRTTSAGLLPYARGAQGLQVFAAHLGGPFWSRKQAGAWSIVKGEYDPAVESPADAARREFAEETGIECPAGELMDLGEVRQRGGKVVRAFGIEAPTTLSFVRSNTFELEWPPHSGRIQSFPEIDAARWMAMDEARRIMVTAQAAFLDRLAERLAGLVGG